MADRDGVDLQREADEERSGVVKSEATRRRLECFKQGEIDRWRRSASFDTPVGDFYIERP
jgi:hypothetical protein